MASLSLVAHESPAFCLGFGGPGRASSRLRQSAASPASRSLRRNEQLEPPAEDESEPEGEALLLWTLD